MSDLELLKDEKFIADDEFLLRLVRHLDPDVRRDIVGWLKVPDPLPPEEHKSDFGAAIRDYLRGAAQVINPFPATPPVSALSDYEALVADSNAICNDMRDVALFVRYLIERERMAREQHGGQRQRHAATQSAARG